MPKLSIPVAPILAMMRAQQYLHFKIGLPAPVLTPHEMLKVSVSHCSTNEAAERDFQYKPSHTPEEAMQQSLAYYAALQERDRSA